MLEILSERQSLILRTLAELILVISGVIYLAMVCILFFGLLWWAYPLIIIPIAILAALFFRVLDHSLTDRQALIIIFIWLPLVIYALSWLLSHLPSFED